MKQAQQGFTLIELVVVIIILGILSATALPRFIDLSGDARNAAAQGVAAALASGASVNFAARTAGNASGVQILNCSAAAQLVQGGLPAGYSVTAQAIAAGAVANCVVTAPQGASATAQVIGVN